ncbi:S8 family serine peptidase [Pseudomonas aeruginosa]
MAKNMDGLTTYVDLVSLLIEENHDGRREAERLADKYGARVVGAIPPLNLLPVAPAGARPRPARRAGPPHRQRDQRGRRGGGGVRAGEGRGNRGGAPARGQAGQRPRRVGGQSFHGRGELLPASGPRPPGAAGDPPGAHRGDRARRRLRRSRLRRLSPGPCKAPAPRTCSTRAMPNVPTTTVRTVAGILAARWDQGGNSGFLRGLDRASQGFEVIVERNSDAGITANVAASVNLVEDGVRVLNWSWGIHRVGARDVDGDEVDSLVRSGIAMSGYESCSRSSSSGCARSIRTCWWSTPPVTARPTPVPTNTACRPPSSPSSCWWWAATSAASAKAWRWTTRPTRSSAAPRTSTCGWMSPPPPVPMPRPWSGTRGGEVHCGTSYATPMVAGTVAAILSLNPRLRPEEIRMLLRRSAMTIGGDYDFRAGRCRGPHRTDPALGARLPPGPP